MVADFKTIIHTCVYTCTSVRMHIYTHIYVYTCMSVRMHTCIHIHVYKCLSTRMRIYVCIHNAVYSYRSTCISINKYVDDFPFRPNTEGKASESFTTNTILQLSFCLLSYGSSKHFWKHEKKMLFLPSPPPQRVL